MLTCAELFTKLLTSKEMNFNVHTFDDGDILVEFPYRGKTAKLVFAGKNGEYLSLYMQYESIPEDKFAEVLLVCNQLNAQYKWVKFYIDKDNDLMLQTDALLSTSTADEEAFEMLVRMIEISEKAKGEIMKAIYA